MSHSGATRRVLAIPAAALLVSVVACAPEPATGWQPPEGRAVEGMTLVDPALMPAEGSVEGADAAEPVPNGDPAPSTEAQTALALDPASLGLVGGRLRNDALPFAARFVYVPGVPALTEHMNAVLRSAIEATGVAYTPQVHGVEAGLADRGCVPGSATWPAADVLARPETGPAGGAGTAVTCELTGAFGSMLTIAVRVVSGSASGISGDTVQRLMVDVQQGTVADLGDRWSADAPAELWTGAVELLRQRAGGLSSAAIADPDAAQVALARAALDHAAHTAAGLRVTVGPGLAAPELAGLGVAATTEPIELLVDEPTARSWASASQLALLDGMTDADGRIVPFVGVTAPATEVPVDCALLPCVALTYDDGPSAYTSTLLDTLRDSRVSATFYMMGGYAQGSPDIVARAAAEGHELGSHTWSHPDLTKIPLADARQQVVSAADLLRRLSGQAVATFRPPYGEVNSAIIAAVGMPAVLWSVDTNDWRKPGIAALFERAVGGARPGGIILFHDTHADTVAAAGDIITGLRNRGFEPVTVSELFGGTVPLGRVSAR